MTKSAQIILTFALASFAVLDAAELNGASDKADLDQLVAKTHAASLKLREDVLRKTVAKDTAWPSGVWGENLWCLAALYLNEKTDMANDRLLKRAKEYIATKPANAPATSPEQPGNLPWTFFSVTDYVRTFGLFRAKSPHCPNGG